LGLKIDLVEAMNSMKAMVNCSQAKRDSVNERQKWQNPFSKLYKNDVISLVDR